MCSSTAFRRWPIDVRNPVLTKVIDQSWMSVESSSTLPAAVAQDEVVGERLLVVEEVLLDRPRPCSRDRG